MMRGNSNKRGMFFLLFLTAFSFGAVKIFHIIENDLKVQGRVETVAQSSQGCSTGSMGVALNSSLSNDKHYQIMELPESAGINLQVGGSSVKGSTNTASAQVNCTDSFANLLQLNEADVCMSGSGDLNYETASKHSDEVRVRKDDRLDLVTVKYPLAFWLGNFEYIDSNKNILNGNTAYRGNGEQIDENYQARHLAPKEANTFRQEVSDTVRQNFALEADVDGPNPIPEGKQKVQGEYVVHNVNNASCACNPEVAVSDYNVGKSNYIASDPTYGGYRRVQAPKGDNYDNDDPSVCLQEGAKYETMTDEHGVVLACNNRLAFVEGLFEAVFAPRQWDGCTGHGCVEYDKKGNCVAEGKTDECINAESVAVKMPSIFGEPYKCTTEFCANAFMTYLQRASLAPTTASSKKIASTNTDESLMFFVATDCRARIVGSTTIIPIKCLWDASPLLANYNLQKKDHSPRGDSKRARNIDYPKSFDQYWKNTDKAIIESAKYYKLQNLL